MSISPRYLSICEKLQKKGCQTVFERGAIVARGFADLGYEEFVMIDHSRCISLASGLPSEIPEDHHRFFFQIHSVTDIVECISKAGFDILSLIYQDQRHWLAKVVDVKSGLEHQFEHEELECVLGLVFLHALGPKK